MRAIRPKENTNWAEHFDDWNERSASAATLQHAKALQPKESEGDEAPLDETTPLPNTAFNEGKEEEKKEDNENEPEPVPNRFAQPKGQDTDYDKPNQEQEDKFNDFMKGATTDDSKRFGLIVIDKEGNINKHYKSITEFKDDKENYNK